MKGKVNLLARKVFATAIALAMSIPPQAFAASAEEDVRIYDATTSVMGINEEEPEEVQVQNQDQSQTSFDYEDYNLGINTQLDPSLTELTYTIKAKRKENSEEADTKLRLNLSALSNSNISDLRLIEASTDTEESQKEDGEGIIKSLILESKAEDEIVYTVKANINKAKKDRTYDLILGLTNGENSTQPRAYKLKVEEKTILEDENEKKLLSLILDESQNPNPKAVYKEEGIFGGVFAKKDTITWTDFILNSDENKEFEYEFNLDQNQETDNSKIALDYYEATETGFEIKKEFSQEIDFAQKINFEIPQNFIAKITLKTQVDKKNTNIENYTLNNRMTKNPIYIEGSEEKSSDDDEADGEDAESNKKDPAKEEEDPSQTEKTEESQEKSGEENKEESSENKEENLAEDKDEDIKIDDAKSQEEENEENKENRISALILNKDSLVNRLEEEDKLTDEIKTAIEDLAEDLDSYNDAKITDQDLKDFTKAMAETKSIEKEDLRFYFEQILSGLNKQNNKAANLNIDEIIDYAYPEEKAEETETEENLTNLEKADKELKEALGDEKNGLEEIQALLDSFEEKYKLSREDQEKLMTDNNDAINALVEKDRNENFRPNNLRQQESNSWDNKEFLLDTTMQVKAGPAWPIPKGWHFDVKVGPYLKINGSGGDYDPPILDLTNTYGEVIAQGKYHEDGNNHYIRYTFVRELTRDVNLKINQYFKFDTKNIDKNTINVDVVMAPKNNPEQKMTTKIVYINDATPVISTGSNVVDKGQSEKGTYPYQLDWKTTSQLLKDKDGDQIKNANAIVTDGAYIEWDIEVNTAPLLDENNDPDLDFDNLNLTVFASSKQGLKNFYYQYSKEPINSLDDAPQVGSREINEILTQNVSIPKKDLGDTLYIKVKGMIDPDQTHDTYSIGLRVNPDKNYIQKLLNDALQEYQNIPSPLKWIKGVKKAKRFSEIPFNLVETKIPATIGGLQDDFTNERFYYDNTRTIVAKRTTDKRTDWSALDLIRRGETNDPALEAPEFNPELLENEQLRIFYYKPLQEGGYKRTSQIAEVELPNGQFYPGTLIAYEYPAQTGERNDTYYMNMTLNDKYRFNVDGAEETEGGYVNLFTEKISKSELDRGYIAYIERPYPIMRINQNFDMVQCFNDGIADPTIRGKNGVFLDMNEDVSGDFLISRLNENIGKARSGYKLEDRLRGDETFTEQGQTEVNIRNGYKSEAEAMEELMKRIYFYGEEVKKEYPASHENGKDMHRLIENSMYQRVIHYFTDNKDLKTDYFASQAGITTYYTADEWKVPYTLSGEKDPKGNLIKYYKGQNGEYHINNGYGPRKLKDNEEVIGHENINEIQQEQAEQLLKKVLESYGNGDWTKEKSDSVKLVFYSHTNEGRYQELITGRVMEPIEIEKLIKDEITNIFDKHLGGATFTFTNTKTGEYVEWESPADSDKASKLYLRPGTYRVHEEAPDNYQAIDDFTIKVTREEINADSGEYPVYNNLNIHVNDGFESKVSLEGEAQKAPNGTELVEIDKSQIKVSVKNIQDSLGELKFAKQNQYYNLDGATFTLNKLDVEDLDAAKTEFNKENPSYDKYYSQESSGYRGDFEFKNIPKGFYILEETKAPEGYKGEAKYLLQAEEKEVEDADGKKKTKVVVKFVGDNVPDKQTSDGRTVIVNEPKDTEIRFRKIRKQEASDPNILALSDARFKLESIWTKDGSTYSKELTSFYNSKNEKDEKDKKIPEKDKGYFIFDGLKVGVYKLTEIQAPYGYQKTDSYWIVEVTEKEDGDLGKKVYEVKSNGERKDITPNSEPTYPIENEPRKTNTSFTKYLGEIEKNKDGSIKKDADGNPIIKKTEVTKKLYGSDGKPVRFELYEADFYGAIVGEAIDTNIIQDENGLFHLKNLEFGRYYVLRETNPPFVNGVQYDKANDILLKVEAEAIAQEGRMKVVVRDPNTNAVFGSHAIFNGVIDFKEGEKLGKFSIRKTGNNIRYIDTETGRLVEIDKNNLNIVGLRRAYFRLYGADKDFNISYKDPDGKYAEEYAQKVTPGNPIIGYLTEDQARNLTDDERNALKVAGYSSDFPNNDENISYAVDDQGRRIRMGTDPKTLPKNQGIVTFDNLKPGHYVLEEFRGPAGYERTTQQWYIKVFDDGRTIRSDKKDDPAFLGNISARSIADLTGSPRLMMAGVNVSEPQGDNFSSPSPRSLILDDNIGQNQTEPNVTVEKEELELGDEIIGDRVTASGSDVKIENTYTNQVMGKNGTTSQIEVTTTVDQLPNDEFKVTIRTKLLQGPGGAGYYKLSFNNNFEFVNGSTHTDRQPSVTTPIYNGRWHVAYDSSNNEIYFNGREPRLKRGQTAIIEVKVRPSDKASLVPGRAYDLINEVNYRSDTSKIGTVMHRIKSPTVTYKDAPVITYKDETVLVRELDIPTMPIRRANPNMYVGDKRTVFAGSKGKVEEKRRYKYIDGVKQDNDYQLIETITTEAHAPIVEYGTKEKPEEPDPEDPDQPGSEASLGLEVNFTYSNSENGQATPPPGEVQNGPGEIILQDAEGNELERQTAQYVGKVEFTTKLDPSKDYRLIYNISDELAKKWTLPNKPVYSITSGDMKDITEKIIVNISNGNTMDIFNKDETGFRIPLRVTKVNENKGVLTGAQFKARKLINGEQLIDVYENGKPTGEKEHPKYYDEVYDGVSEATGLPGDNYFRELSPGIYELEEIKTPDGSYRLPKDEDGNPKKWYFKVQIADGKQPSDDDYMEISFKFDYKLPASVDDKRWNKGITEDERKELRNKEIRGIDFGDGVYDYFTEIIPDNHRSDPARPDAPYKGIDDVRVTNYTKTTELKFFKKDLANRQNIKDAVFTLKRAKDDKITFDSKGKPEFENLDEQVPATNSKGEEIKDENGNTIMEDKFIKPEPYQKGKSYAEFRANETSGVHFTNIAEGTYILEETESAPGYKHDDTFLAIKFSADKDGKWKQEITAYKLVDGEYVKVEKIKDINSIFLKGSDDKLNVVFNEKTYIDLVFNKIEAGTDSEGNDIYVNTSAFKLQKVDKETKKPLANTTQWIEQSRFGSYEYTFKNLDVGYYKLTETLAIDKYEKPEPWYFEVVQGEDNKLKIVFETLDGAEKFTPASTKTDKDKRTPEMDYDNPETNPRPKDLRIANVAKIPFNFQKVSDQFTIDKDNKKNPIPLKDARFVLKKVRETMDPNDKTKSYEYDKDGNLVKYNNKGKVNEYVSDGTRVTINGKTYKFDTSNKFVTTDPDTEQTNPDNVKPDSITSATGKYYAESRSYSSGGVNFRDLDEGIYELEEVGVPSGYEGSNKQFRWIFKVQRKINENGQVQGLEIVHGKDIKIEQDKDLESQYFETFDNEYYDCVYSKLGKTENINELTDSSYSHQITNTKTTTDLKWKKIKDDGSTVIDKDSRFTLYKISRDVSDVTVAKNLQYIDSPYIVESKVVEKDGKKERGFIVENLAKGIYVLEETKAPDGYERMDRYIVIKISEGEGGSLTKTFYEMKKNDTKPGEYEDPIPITENDIRFIKRIQKTGQKPEAEIVDDHFLVMNKEIPYYFYLSKGFMENNQFEYITKGELKVKIYRETKVGDETDEAIVDKNVYERTIDLSQGTSHRIDLPSTIELGKNYILEEVEAPDGYVKTKYKYRLRFSYDDSWETPFVATLVAVLKEVEDKDGNKTWIPLQNDDKQNISDSGQLIAGGQPINTGFPFRIVNNKTEIEFTKVGRTNGDSSTDKNLENVEFYLEKREANGSNYYPLTEKMYFIKKGKDKSGNYDIYYLEDQDGNKIPGKIGQTISPENNRKVYTSGKDDEAGKIKIENLTDGFYRIQEINTPEGYIEEKGPVKEFSVIDGEIYVDGKKLTGDDKEDPDARKIINRRETPPAKINFVKIDGKTNENLPGAKFKLQKKVGDNYTDTDKKAESDSQGNFSFDNLESGTYQVVETTAPSEEYTIVEPVVYKFKVDGDSITHLDKKTEKPITNPPSGNIEIKNYKVEYPSTGGPGMWIGFTVLGLVVMIAGAFIYNKKQTRLTD